MSYDLEVYFTPTPELRARWEGALADEGVPLRFDPGIDLLQLAGALEGVLGAASAMIDAKAGERIALSYIETGPVRLDPEEVIDLDKVPALLRDAMARATHRAYLATSAGRSAAGVALQMIAAGTLAKAASGVVMDPQERGYMGAAEALAYAHETVDGWLAAEARSRNERARQREQVDRFWKWFQGVFVAACAAWAGIALFLFLMKPLHIQAGAPWVAPVIVVPFIASVYLAARTVRQALELFGVSWPLTSLLGLLSAFLPIHALAYAWVRKRYRAISRG